MNNSYKYHKTPEWFNNANYRALSDFTLDQWLNAIQYRQALYVLSVVKDNLEFSFLQGKPSGAAIAPESCLSHRMTIGDVDNLLDSYIEDVKALLKNPTKYIDNLPFIGIEDAQKSIIATPKIKHVINQLPYFHHRELMDGEYKTCISRDDEILEKDINSFFEERNVGDRFLSVDIHAPTKDIEVAFKGWLNNEKRKLDTVKQKPGKDVKKIMSSLIEHRVLQYLDLYLYLTLVKEQKPKNTYIANVIFDDLYDLNPVSKLERSTLKYANQITDGRFTEWLYYVIDRKPAQKNE